MSSLVTIGTTVLLALGLASGVKITDSSRVSKLVNSLAQSKAPDLLAELGSGATSHNCQYSINRIKAGPANFNTIIGSGNKYTDATFPASSEMIRWTDYPGSDNLATYANSCTYSRAKDKLSAYGLYGNNVTPYDIT
jgi:hypothetical protein